MKISQHGLERIKTRGVNLDIIDLMDYIIPAQYLRGANIKSLNRKDAGRLATHLKKYAKKIEQASGTELILSRDDSTLITVYRKNGRKK